VLSLTSLCARSQFIVFNVYNPEMGIAFIIILDILIAKIGDGNNTGQEKWVPPVAACFVGILSMLFLKYAAGIILDTIDVCFICWAVDKDNNVDLAESEFALLVCELPGVGKVDTGTAPNNAAAFAAQYGQPQAPMMQGQPMMQPQVVMQPPPGMVLAVDPNTGQQMYVPAGNVQYAPPPSV
jgi:hypothetical protein